MSRPRRVKPVDHDLLDAIGKAVIHFAETGDASQLKRVNVDWRRFGQGLIEIARGRDAREVLGQAGGDRSMEDENLTRSFVYWKARAEEPANIKRAVELAQKHLSYLDPPSAASIRRYAREHSYILKLFENGIPYNGEIVDTTALRAYMAKRSKRGNW